jgi:hypothetical protein
MNNKRFALLTVLVMLSGIVLVTQSSVQAGAYKLKGAWIRTSVIGEDTIRTKMTLTPADPSGKSAIVLVQGVSVDANVGGLCPNADYLTDLVGEGVMTGPSSNWGTVVGYSMRIEEPRDQIECIWIITGIAEFTGPDSEVGTGFVSIYPTWLPAGFYPNPDGDNDGLPDPGVPPFACIPLPFTGVRVPMLDPCTP